MAWIAVDLDKTLVEKDPETGQDVPVDGALEAMATLAGEGHRLSVYTARFQPMPDSEKYRLQQEIQNNLLDLGFPPELEVWAGNHKPLADAFIDDKAITFDNDWGLALAQLQVVMEERGLVPGPQPGSAENALTDSTESDPNDDLPPSA